MRDSRECEDVYTYGGEGASGDLRSWSLPNLDVVNAHTQKTCSGVPKVARTGLEPTGYPARNWGQMALILLVFSFCATTLSKPIQYLLLQPWQRLLSC